MGTLNLCLKMPEKMQETRNESDHHGLRKRQKTGEKTLFDFLQIQQFLDVFLAHVDWIKFWLGLTPPLMARLSYCFRTPCKFNPFVVRFACDLIQAYLETISIHRNYQQPN